MRIASIAVLIFYLLFPQFASAQDTPFRVMTMRLGANFLYENNAGVFTDVAAAAGAQDVNGDGGGVVVADFNNDGCQDLYLANTDEDAILQNNCDGTFTDVTVGSGLDASGARRGTSASVGDYDGDGLLDLYVAHHTPVPGSPVVDDKTKDQDYLFHNDGNFVFTDVSDDMLGASDRENASFIGAWTDFDNDGDLDIYLIRDCGFDGSGAMDLWRNDGGTDGVTDWTFTQMASSVNGNWCQNGMGVAVGDYDRNGYMDLFYTDNGAAPGGTDPNRAGTVLLANSATGFTDMDTKDNILDVEITTAGVQEINVWMREDGLFIDKIVLTQDAGFTPEGLGPAESPRVSAAAMIAAM